MGGAPRSVGLRASSARATLPSPRRRRESDPAPAMLSSFILYASTFILGHSYGRDCDLARRRTPRHARGTGRHQAPCLRNAAGMHAGCTKLARLNVAAAATRDFPHARLLIETTISFRLGLEMDFQNLPCLSVHRLRPAELRTAPPLKFDPYELNGAREDDLFDGRPV